MILTNTYVNQKIINDYQKFCYIFNRTLLIILIFSLIYFCWKKYHEKILTFCFCYQKVDIGKIEIWN